MSVAQKQFFELKCSFNLAFKLHVQLVFVSFLVASCFQLDNVSQTDTPIHVCSVREDAALVEDTVHIVSSFKRNSSTV